MLYYFFNWLTQNFDLPGGRLLNYISIRVAVVVVVSLAISTLFGKRFILFLQRKQIGETVRNLELPGQNEKAGTPTMGGILIVLSVLIPILLFAKLNNIYIILMIITTLWFGLLGFADDYIKVFRKNKNGLSKKQKLLGQIVIGILVGFVMYFHSDTVIKEKIANFNRYEFTENVFSIGNTDESIPVSGFGKAEKSSKTTIPFFKNNEFNYAWLTTWMGDKSGKWSAIFYILIVTFIIAAVSNGANLTDGLDGLAVGVSAFILIGIAILAYVSGNTFFANYLNIMYIPNISEIVIFTAALIGALIGFYWWNCYPARIFMGDTGSLMLGGVIAVLCVIIRKEFLIPVLCGIFFIETLSVIIQVYHFRWFRKKNGREPISEERFFLMTPLHHHYQKKAEKEFQAKYREKFITEFTKKYGIAPDAKDIPQSKSEPKIVQHFIIVSMLLVILAIITLKIR